MSTDADHKAIVVFKEGTTLNVEGRKYHINKLVKAVQEGGKDVHVQDTGANGGSIAIVPNEVAAIHVEKL